MHVAVAVQQAGQRLVTLFQCAESVIALRSVANMAIGTEKVVAQPQRTEKDPFRALRPSPVSFRAKTLQSMAQTTIAAQNLISFAIKTTFTRTVLSLSIVVRAAIVSTLAQRTAGAVRTMCTNGSMQ
jgi:hypothetical protein